MFRFETYLSSIYVVIVIQHDVLDHIINFLVGFQTLVLD